ncbi:beta-class carbonic anhydrase [Smaragdicoccus niigatensis]|uniref:beta-class carbonic anhydrase n=1 Tax=Smaragdicoccus niigatensis TaxID=359359 RepID=UPI00035CC2EB|nr:carbonic anhydrase [Smaragdicoccus niigatensis]
MTDIDQLVQANEWYRLRFPEPRPRKPKRQLAIVSCMDSRLDLFSALGLDVGDAHIIRNAGGLVTDDVLRSLAISQREIGTRAVMIVQHTNCGMFGFDDQKFRRRLLDESGQKPAWDVAGFSSLERSVRESIAKVASCPWLIRGGEVRGFIFNVTSAEVTEVPRVAETPSTSA